MIIRNESSNYMYVSGTPNYVDTTPLKSIKF